MVQRFSIRVAIAVMIASIAEQAAAQIGIVAEQSSTRSLNSQAVSLTTLNGAPGFISATTQRPFVTGLIPVVADYGGAYAPVYGPLTLVPPYQPGPSVIRQRIEQIRREGLPPPPSRSERRQMAERGTAQSQNDFTSRLAVARKSSAGRPSESIAEIRRRQQQHEYAGQERLRK
jgi:hypothetical protein